MANSNDGWGCGCLFILAVIGAAGFALYNVADSSGLVPHSATVDLYMDGNWLEGENRTCLGTHNAPAPNLGDITSLSCSEKFETEKPHNMTVKFWGKTIRAATDNKTPELGSLHHWLCTRHSDGFVCKALD
jgi:hypothetical protein